jgi:hypothetical protein
MRRTSVLALALSAVALGAGVAQADVTDVIVTTALPGTLSITGAGSLPTGPLGGAASTTIGGSSSAISGSVLTVTDATGVSTGWQVNAKYVPLATGALSTVPLPAGVLSAVNIGGGNVTVNGTTGVLATTNAVLGVADSGLSFSNGDLSASGGRTLLSTTGDGRGVTAFNTSYTLNLPAKTTSAATLYTGSVLYTVGPTPAVSP